MDMDRLQSWDCVQVEPDGGGGAPGVQGGEVGERERDELQQLALRLQLQRGRGVQPHHRPARHRQRRRVHHALNRAPTRSNISSNWSYSRCSLFQFLTPTQPSVKATSSYTSICLQKQTLKSTNHSTKLVLKRKFSQRVNGNFIFDTFEYLFMNQEKHSDLFMYLFYVFSLPLLYICIKSLSMSF